MKLPLKLNNDGIHYSPNKCYSYGMFLNIIVGGRGIGKTTGFLINALQRWANTGEEFIYLRRYNPEVKAFIHEGTISTLLEGVEYKGDGAKGSIMYFNKKVFGYVKSLATAITNKSTAFPKVKLIIYDEAFLPKGSNYHYIKDEVTLFLNFVSTIFREKTGCRVVVLGNNDDMFNPFLSYFKIPWFDTMYINKEKGIYVESAKPSEKLLEIEKRTELFKLTEGTQFGDYHYANALLTNVNGKVEPRPNNCRLYFKLKMNEYCINVYKYNIRSDSRLWIEYVYIGKANTGFNNGNNSYVILDDNNINYYNINLLKQNAKKYFNYMHFNERTSFKDNTSIEAFGRFLELL